MPFVQETGPLYSYCSTWVPIKISLVCKARLSKWQCERATLT